MINTLLLGKEPGGGGGLPYPTDPFYAPGSWEVISQGVFDQPTLPGSITMPTGSSGSLTQVTMSFWQKMTPYSGGYSYHGLMDFWNVANTGNRFRFVNYAMSGDASGQNTGGFFLITNNGNRFCAYDFCSADWGSWAHHVLQFDSTQANAADRIKWWQNGRQTTITDNLGANLTDADVPLNHEWPFLKAGNLIQIGGVAGDPNIDPHAGLFSEFIIVDGQILPPTTFGNFDGNNIWRPIRPPEGTFSQGSHDLYLDFGQTDPWNPYAKSVIGDKGWVISGYTDSGNLCTRLSDAPGTPAVIAQQPLVAGAHNPADHYIGFSRNGSHCELPMSTTYWGKRNGDLEDGELSATGDYLYRTGTGGWIWQVHTPVTFADLEFGICDTRYAYGLVDSLYVDPTYDHVRIDLAGGIAQVKMNGTSSNKNLGITMSAGSTWTFLFNSDTGQMQVTDGTTTVDIISGHPQGNTWQKGDFLVWRRAYDTTVGYGLANCGQRPWIDAGLPSGTFYKETRSNNFPAYTINPRAGFSAHWWKGDGAARSIDVGHAPGLVHVTAVQKDGYSGLLDHTGRAHDLLRTNSEGLGGEAVFAPATQTAGGITNFSGNTVNFGAGSAGDYNASAENEYYQMTSWQLGTPTTNNDGDTTATVAANATYGQSAITFTLPRRNGITVGHGLGVQPEMALIRCNAGNSLHYWQFASAISSVPGDPTWSYSKRIEQTNIGENIGLWGSSPTSTVVNPFVSSYLPKQQVCTAYVFAQVPGYFKAARVRLRYSRGSTTNNTMQGLGVTLGFRPAMVWIWHPNAAVDRLTMFTMNSFAPRRSADTINTYKPWASIWCNGVNEERNTLDELVYGERPSIMPTNTGFVYFGRDGALGIPNNQFYYWAWADDYDVTAPNCIMQESGVITDQTPAP